MDSAKDVRIKSVSVISVDTDLKELPFNKGYFAVDITFFLDVCLELFGCHGSQSMIVNGVCVFTKKTVLFGSESGVKTFYSNGDVNDDEKALPIVSVQVADPVALNAKICECCHVHHKSCCGTENMPAKVTRRYGEMKMEDQDKGVFVSIGLFVIIQMIRNVQILIPAYDFCLPSKDCSNNRPDDPCELFSSIDFPTDAFFPPRAADNDKCSCN